MAPSIRRLTARSHRGALPSISVDTTLDLDLPIVAGDETYVEADDIVDAEGPAERRPVLLAEPYRGRKLREPATTE